MKKIGILTSGGDTPGMNACIQAVVKMARSKGIIPLGIKKGYGGLIEGRVAEIQPQDVEEIVEKGGTILKTARCEEMKTPEGQKKALRVLKAFGIEGLIVIGGDGSLKGASVISKMGVPTIGLPGTIDNDLGYTDFTIGFDTAINCVIGEITKIRDTMESHERIGIIEVMGNKCGDIAFQAGMAGDAEFILVPEIEFDVDELCEKLIASRIQGKTTSIVVIAEGAGKGEALSNYIRAKTALDVKAIVLGYVQRGGAPSAFDRIIAIKMGMRAVELLLQGKGDRVVGIRNNKIVDYDIYEALEMKLKFDHDLYKTYMAINNI